MAVSNLHLRCAAAVLLYTTSTAAWENLWSVSIDESPAPPVQDEPPFSQGAIRNRAFLKYQIPAMAASYLGFMIILGLLYITVGRRLRKSALSADEKGIEMVKPLQRALDPSPVSPSQSFRGWTKLKGLGSRSPGSLSGRSGPMDDKSPTSIVSFDSTILEKDRAKQQDEMERLYAAVIATETKAPKQVLVGQNETHQDPLRSPMHVRGKSSFSQRDPPQLHPEPELAISPPPLTSPMSPPPMSPQSPSSPRARAIYPPYAARGGDPTSPTSPVYTNYLPREASQQRSQNISHPQQPEMPRQSSASSVHSNRTNRSNRSIRNLQISRPAPSRYPRSDWPEDDVEASAPLTPTLPTNNNNNLRVEPSLMSPPFTPFEDQYEHDQGGEDEGMAETLPEDIIHSYGYDELESPRPVPGAAPQRVIPRQPGRSALRPNIPPPLPPMPSYGPTQSSGSLPLREFAPTRNDAGVGMAQTTVNAPHEDEEVYNPMKPFGAGRPRTPKTAEFPGSPFSPPPRTGATPVKTTFLSPRKDVFAHRKVRTPKTAGTQFDGLSPMYSAYPMSALRTPYSAYMPTPITPVTPHLVTRHERKARQREMGRNVIQEEDVVANENELWGYVDD